MTYCHCGHTPNGHTPRCEADVWRGYGPVPCDCPIYEHDDND